MLIATGPGWKPLPPGARELLADAMTYYERRCDYTAQAEGGAKFDLIERRMYRIDQASGAVEFPLGLKSRIVKALKTNGFVPTLSGGTLLSAARPEALAMNWDGLFADFTPYPDQEICLQRTIGADGGIISATTSYGKSVIIRMLCRLYHKARIHVVTKSRVLAQEIHSDLSQVIPNVGFVGDNKRVFGRVTMLMADSLHHGLGEADIVIADEAHQLIAPTYTYKLGLYRSAKMIGFTASPKGRADNRDVLLEAIFGPVLFTMSQQEAEALGRVVPVTVEWLRVVKGPDTAGIRNIAMRERAAIWQNGYRNRVIADRVSKFDADEQVLVMVKTIDHAVRLKALLPDFTLAYASKGMDEKRLANYIKQGLLPADEPLMDGKRIRHLREQFAANKLKHVIANYVWSTGVNFRHLGVLVRADAAASAINDIQIPGRICRRIPGVKESALLIDCSDEWDDRFYRKASGRRRNYQARGFTQIQSPHQKLSND